ncbi:HAD family hydrolase [Vreelandella titanicae]|uniref:HAD family hydrolase n=1 Tax=Vreelandella titanicae TaxID=664683 RepID=A0A558J219_9GAMM|nr:HAD family hydrolase [Halomonas titanicae]TVU87584.1 HAD family hydrolase [Halomonas titanicae]
MKFAIDYYKTLIFDCDGVVLSSNQVKTDAFYQAALPYGEAAAKALVNYHVSNGGISRYKKFAYFVDHLVPSKSGPGLDKLLERYASQVREGLMGCEVASGLQALRESTTQARWLIVSGGDQTELRDVFSQRGIAGLFDGGIFGSPDSKDVILKRELDSGNIQQPALFLGDSKYDHQAASTAGLDFVFMSDWTEVSDWQHWVTSQKINVKQNIAALME